MDNINVHLLNSFIYGVECRFPSILAFSHLTVIILSTQKDKTTLKKFNLIF